ncbi:RDD family protein [Streptomyces sp. NPDC005476]|uniref:RDD family protein n=1 Tax=Streptomyces sp. NPDC005476 TaxID=3156882 RepID=UPI00345210AB
MSAPTPAPGDDRPREGYYPDPSIPGYVRYWNGASWVPGTSRPAPSDGRSLTSPAGSPPASVEETGPHFFDEDPQPADPYGGRPEPASAWGADRAHQSGFGGDQDRRVSWGSPQGADPRTPPSAPVTPEGLSTSTDGTATIPPAEPEGAGDVVSGGTFVFRRPTTGDGTAPSSGASGPAGLIPDEGTVTFRPPGPRKGGQDGASGPQPGSGLAPGPAGNATAFPAAAQGPAAAPGAFGAPGTPGAPGFGDPASAGAGSAPGAAAYGAQGPVGAPAGSGTAPAEPGFGAGKAAAERAAAQPPGAPTPGAPTPGVPAVGAPAPQGPAHVPAPAPAVSPPAPAPQGRGTAPAAAAPASAPQGPAGFPAAQPAAPQGPAGFPAAQPGARPGAQAPASGHPGPQVGAPGVPQQAGGPPPQPSAAAQATAGPAAQASASAPMAAGSGGGQPSWAQQVHQLAGAEDGPVTPWKPPVEDIFQAAARRQASARPAGLGKRLAARLVDTLVLAAVTAAAAVPLGVRALDHVDQKVDAAKLSGEKVTVWLLDGTTSAYLGIVLAVLLGFGVVYEALPTARWGRTLGKKLFGLEVRDIGGGEPPSFGAALRRWFVYSVPGLLGIGVVGVVWGLFDKPWRQCWHDKAAHTFVAG